MSNVFLNVNGIEVIYNHVILVLKGVSLQVPEGGIVALLGGNGAGKTTTLRAICQMVRTTGSIRIDGQDVIGRSTEDVVRVGVAHVPDGRGTFTALSVEEKSSAPVRPSLRLSSVTQHRRQRATAARWKQPSISRVAARTVPGSMALPASSSTVAGRNADVPVDTGPAVKVRPVIVKGKIVTPTSFDARYPRELETILLKAMALDPEQRYLTAEAFRQALVEYAPRLGPVATAADLIAARAEVAAVQAAALGSRTVLDGIAGTVADMHQQVIAIANAVDGGGDRGDYSGLSQLAELLQREVSSFLAELRG